MRRDYYYVIESFCSIYLPQVNILAFLYYKESLMRKQLLTHTERHSFSFFDHIDRTIDFRSKTFYVSTQKTGLYLYQTVPNEVQHIVDQLDSL